MNERNDDRRDARPPARLRALAITLIASLALMFTGCGDGEGKDSAKKDNANTGDKPTLVFTAIPDADPDKLKERFDQWAAHLSKELGVPVEFKPSSSYEASVEMFRSGDVQLAWFGGLSGVQAVIAVPGAEAIAMGEADAEFVSYFIANQSTGLKESEEFPMELADLSFTFGSPGSTSGRLMPTKYIIEKTGKSPEEFFKEKPIFQLEGGHDATLDAVLSGAVQAGVLNYSKYDQRAAADPSIRQRAPIIWKTPTYADYNFTAHPKLEEMYGKGFTEKLQKVLINTTDEKLLAAFPRKKLIKASNEDFAEIEKVARELGMIR